MSRREAILEGRAAAARLHDRLASHRHIEANGGPIDVFGALLAVNAALVFRPLDGLLGFCIKGPDVPGVVISTQRSLHIQRFTGSHELGHVELGHTLSLDGEEILERGGFSKNEKEIAADSFASAFLLPKWLMQTQARRQKWNRIDMEDPMKVYQMSLRLGASFTATAIALERNEIIDEATRDRLVNVPLRKVKQSLLGSFTPPNFYPDVWLITELDHGQPIEGGPNDLFVIRLPEMGSAGYLWDLSKLKASGFAVLQDRREIDEPEISLGGATTRNVTAQQPEPGNKEDEPPLPRCGSIELEQRRPWQKDAAPAASLSLPYDLSGKEVGMPRVVRRQLLAA